MVLVLGPSSFLLSFRFLAFLLLPPVLGFFLGSVCAFFPPLLLGFFSGFSSQNPPWFCLLLSSSVPKILLCSGSFFVSSPVVFLFLVFFPLLFSLPVLFFFPLLRFVRCPPVFVCPLLWFSGPPCPSWLFLLPGFSPCSALALPFSSWFFLSPFFFFSGFYKARERGNQGEPRLSMRPTICSYRSPAETVLSDEEGGAFDSETAPFTTGNGNFHFGPSILKSFVIKPLVKL